MQEAIGAQVVPGDGAPSGENTVSPAARLDDEERYDVALSSSERLKLVKSEREALLAVLDGTVDSVSGLENKLKPGESFGFSF
jgi:hypothetical protein